MKILLVACAWLGSALVAYVTSYLMYRMTDEDIFDIRLWVCVLLSPLMLFYVIASTAVWFVICSSFARKLQGKFGKVCNICEGKIERMIDNIGQVQR